MTDDYEVLRTVRVVSESLRDIANRAAWAGRLTPDMRTEAEAQITILARALGLGEAEMNALTPV
jgi:hypothetical protein